MLNDDVFDDFFSLYGGGEDENKFIEDMAILRDVWIKLSYVPNIGQIKKLVEFVEKHGPSDAFGARLGKLIEMGFQIYVSINLYINWQKNTFFLKKYNRFFM